MDILTKVRAQGNEKGSGLGDFLPGVTQWGQDL